MRHAFAAIMHPVLPWLDLPQYAVCAICAALSLRAGRPLPANLATFPLRPRCAILTVNTIAPRRPICATLASRPVFAVQPVAARCSIVAALAFFALLAAFTLRPRHWRPGFKSRNSQHRCGKV